MKHFYFNARVSALIMVDLCQESAKHNRASTYLVNNLPIYHKFVKKWMILIITSVLKEILIRGAWELSWTLSRSVANKDLHSITTNNM